MGKISLCFTIVSTFACFARVLEDEAMEVSDLWILRNEGPCLQILTLNLRYELYIILSCFRGSVSWEQYEKTVREKNSCPHLTERLKQAFVIYTVWKAGAGVILTSMIMPGRYQIQINAGVQFNTQPKGFTDPFHSP